MILTDKQMELASHVGSLRGDYWSAIAECAMALWSGFPWRAVGPCHEPRVGPMEIRACAEKKLILPPAALNRAPHVLLKVDGNEVQFQGWAFGFEVLRDKNWDDKLQSYVKEDIYEMRSLCNWCQASGWKIGAVDYPRFAIGRDPYPEFGSGW